MQLIKKAYVSCINGHIDNQDQVLKESNFNFYKFWYKGYNLDVESNDDEIVYRFNKKDKIDIYTKEAKDKIKTEYEEMQFVLNMKSILEEIKSQDKYQDIKNFLRKRGHKHAGSKSAKVLKQYM